MLAVKDRPVIFDCRVLNVANCFPMIPLGKAHDDILYGEGVSADEIAKATAKRARCWCEKE